MQVGNLLPVIIVVLLAASFLLLIGSVHNVHIDIASAAAGFYTMLVVLIIEGLIPFVPARVRKLLDDASTLTFLPSFLLLFYAGYRFGVAIRIASVFISFIASVGIGVVTAVLVFIVLSTISRYRGGKP